MVTTAVRDRNPPANTGPTLFGINQTLSTNEDIRLDILMQSNDTELLTCTSPCPTSYFYITSCKIFSRQFFFIYNFYFSTSTWKAL